MSVVMNSEKLAGRSASSVVDYLSEELGPAEIESLIGYYGAAREGVIFPAALGKGAADKGLTRSITREQFQDLHDGVWDGEQQVQVGAQPVWAKNANGTLKRDASGDKVFTYDETGKKRMEPYRTSWIDAVWAPDKSFIEYMIHTTPEVQKQMLDIDHAH